MKKAVRTIVIITLIMVLLVAAIVGVLVYKRYSPGKKHGSLSTYFNVSEGEVAIILQNEVSAYKGVKEGGHIYIPISLVNEKFNDKFYWDYQNLKLILTTPTEIITIEEDKKKYSVNNKSVDMDYPVVILNDNEASGEQEAMVEIAFADAYSEFTYVAFEEPDRVLINYDFTKTAQYAKVTKDVALRKLAGIKSDIMEDLKKGAKVMVLDGEEDSYGFIKIMSESGVVGYAQGKNIGEPKEEAFKTDYVAPEYSHMLMDKKVRLGYHQVMSEYANSDINTIITGNADVNVLCPTWFRSTDNKGSISSYASDEYVSLAHENDIAVWGLCDDFSNDNKIGTVLSNTVSRQKLEKNLVSEAIKYGLDGLNIDFEYVTEENGKDFIQFIRELSVQCRNYGLVLSIDNYPLPMYTAHYDRRAQAEVADYIITMAYDEYTSGSEVAGPNASLTYVQSAIEGVANEVPSEQSIIALPFYSRLWTTKGKKQPTVESYGMQQAADIFTAHGVTPEWDEETSLYYGTYTNEDGAKCEMWLETVDTLEKKFKLVKDSKAAGVAFWKLGLEDSSVWTPIRKYFD